MLLLSSQTEERLMPKYDLVILRDVIEHILIDKKINFLSSVKNYMDDNSRLLVTFPPYFSAFGLHQQAFLKMPFRVFPFLGWLPKIVIYFILKVTNQSSVSISHSFSFKPRVIILDTSGNVIWGDIQYTSGSVSITFVSNISGTVYLS